MSDAPRFGFYGIDNPYFAWWKDDDEYGYGYGYYGDVHGEFESGYSISGYSISYGYDNYGQGDGYGYGQWPGDNQGNGGNYFGSTYDMVGRS